MFSAWGHLVYRWRWAVLLLSTVLLAATIAVVLQGGALGGGNSPQVESGRAGDLMSQELQKTGGSSFMVIMGSATLTTRDPAFKAAMTAALAPLVADSRVSGVSTPYNSGPRGGPAMQSSDGKHALAVINLKADYGAAKRSYLALRALIHSPTLETLAIGDLALNHDFNRTLERDLGRAEVISLPLALLLLLLVFGTVVAALLPLGVGLLAVVGGIAGIYGLAHVADVSQYAFNIVTLIGLGVAIDYSLFIVNRFREELGAGATVEDAVARAMSTAGRAITFSGLTVAIGLAALLFYQGTFLSSMGAAGAIVVAFAVLYALTFLPALLALLGHRVNALRLPLGRPSSGPGFWYALANGVMRRPLVVLALTVPFVLAAGIPFLSIRLANADYKSLPPDAEAHRGYDLLLNGFPGQQQTSIEVVLHYPTGDPLTPARVGALYDLSRRIADMPDVLRVEGPVDPRSTMTRAAYQALYAQPRATLPAALRTALGQTVGAHIAVVTVQTARQAEGDAARTLVRTIRALPAPDGGERLVTGRTAYDLDVINLILSRTPAALAFLMGMTYIVLFLLLGSVVLPLKAVITDVLSISASFGALVWIFQQGHLSKLLNFTPASIDPTVPILLFCIVFGLSMDYEVLLLSRIKEEHERTGDTTQAVAAGLAKSGRLITGAAAIMVVVFAAFALADTVVIKSVGLGMALAVAVDATIVRALIVPAVMRLMGDLNWWAPRPLATLYRRLNLGEPSGEAERPASEAAATIS